MSLNSLSFLPTLSSKRRSFNKDLKKQLQDGNPEKVIQIFKQMQENSSISADNFTYPILLKSICTLSLYKLGLTLHGQIVKSNFNSHPFVQTSVLNMYSFFNHIDAARKVFDMMIDKDVVAWNSMVNGYVSCGMIDDAVELFDSMPEKDIRSFNIMVYGYACAGEVDCARKIFNGIREDELDSVSWNSMLLACCNCGDLKEARVLFEKMPSRNVVSWNTLLGAYLKNGLVDEVLILFEKMKMEEFGIVADDLTITVLLSSCAHLGLLEKGCEIHVYAHELGLTSSVRVTSSLIDMYAKCGCLDGSLNVFYKSEVKDRYCWNAMICGLALHGHAIAAIKLFEQMTRYKISPDDVTFVGLLSACSHRGLVEMGQEMFNSMQKDYRITPKSEHYGCMVDLLCRAGFLEQAFQIIESMPFMPGKSVLGALLSACVNNMELGIGEKVVKVLADTQDLDLNDGDYMMVSNLYASCERWDVASQWREMMNDKGILKTAGRSFIEVDGRVYNFLSGNSITYEDSKIQECTLMDP